MVSGANRQIHGSLHAALNPFIKIDQLPRHPMLVLQIEEIAPDGHKIIF